MSYSEEKAPYAELVKLLLFSLLRLSIFSSQI